MKWYFDFISPFSYLQSTRLQDYENHGSVTCVPVLFAGLLNHFENIGPAELAPKRQWTFEHSAWLAHKHGIEMTMPAYHPFNPLPLLRLCIAAGSSTAVVQRIFRFVWAQGYNPDDAQAFGKLCDELGVSAADLKSDKVKHALRGNTDSAAASGVFGVPTLSVGERNFWGFDSTDMALAFLADQASNASDSRQFPAEAVGAGAALPAGSASRKRPEGNAANVPPAPASHAPRIDYLPEDLAEPAEIVEAVRRRRGGKLIELDRMLLYSPNLARGWNTMLGAVRTELDLDPNLRELAMCTVAVINRAEYEYTQHQPIYIKTGATQEQASALRDPDAALANTALFSEKERAALGLCIDMTRTVQVNQAHFDACERLLGRQQLVELIATIAAYNMVSRFLVALNVHPQN